jgi:hypothetical protein
MSPPLFEKYFMPEYEKIGKIIHAQGKQVAFHMDGRLNVLKELIAQTPIDIIEAFHPPPMGDLPLDEALRVWKDKVIWLGFPGAIYSLGTEAVRNYAVELLRSIVPGERLVVSMSTENIVSNDHLRMLTAVMENAEFPLTEQIVESINKALA